MNTPKHGERGSNTLFFAALLVSFMAIVGLVVDGAGMIKATQEADQLAQHAARQAGQQIDPSSLIQGAKEVKLDTTAAKTAAQKYITTAGATGTVTISGDKIRIQVKTRYGTKFLTLIGIGSMTATGSAEINSTRVTK